MKSPKKPLPILPTSPLVAPPSLVHRVRPMCLHHLPCSLGRLSSPGQLPIQSILYGIPATRAPPTISDWNGSALAVGNGKEGFYGKQATGLSINTTYYYRNRVNMNLGPLDIASDLKVWLDASDLTSVPNPWVDKSGSGNSPEKKGSGHTITTAAQNGLNVLTFNTANQDFYEKTSSTITDDDQTWLFLVKPLSSQTLNGNASAIFALGGGSYDYCASVPVILGITEEEL